MIPRKVIVQKFPGMPSTTPSADSPMIATQPSIVPSTTSLDVVLSPALPTPSVQSPQALLFGSPEVVSFQLDAVENDPFLDKVRSTSTLIVVATSSSTAPAKETRERREHDREPREATIPLEAKEWKRRGCPKKQRKPAGYSHHDNDQPKRRRDESDSVVEGNGQTRKGH